MEETHITFNPRSGKLGTLNENDDDDDDDDDDAKNNKKRLFYVLYSQ